MNRMEWKVIMDKFKSMEELESKTVEHEDWEIETTNQNSPVTILAIHGGGIEPATTELAQTIAEQGKYNYFSFKGIRSKGNNELHVTSIHYDDKDALNLVRNSERAIAIHGCTGDNSAVYIGGNDHRLIELISESLKDIGVDVQGAPFSISGTQDNNIINQTKQDGGVQLELTSQLRKELFNNNDSSRKSRENKDNWGHLMYDFSEAIIKAIERA